RLLDAEDLNSLTKLSRWVAIGNSGITKLIDRLEAKGWVTRVRGSKDRRVWHVKITEKGNKLLADISPKHQGNVASLLTSLSSDDIEQLHRYLTTIKQDLLSSNPITDLTGKTP